MASRNQGLQSKNVTRPSYRTGASRERIAHAGVAQYGQAQGNHFTEQGRDGRMHSEYGGVKAHTGKPGLQSRDGNMVAASTVCGPGGSRTVYARGMQGVHGNANPGNPMAGGDPLAPWSRK
jgi:hypothetical protein